MTVTLKNKTPLTVPDQVRRRAGFKPGDKVEFKVSAGMVTILPTSSPADDADDILTPEESALVKKAEREMRQGKFVTLTQLRHALDRPHPRRRRKTA